VTTIEPMTAQHWLRVHEIYAAGIAGGDATFETNPPTWEQFDISHLTAHRFVAVVDGVVAGWVAVAPVSARPVYAGVVEHSVYVDPAYSGRGIGRALLAAVIESTEAADIWTMRAGVFPENGASLALHELLGFRRIGVHERLGRDRGGWRDVVLLERRSEVAGR
jgi:phosphinothricin acetyltransferase